MGLFKTIKAMLPPDEIEVSGGIENLMMEIADDNEGFNNLLVEYGIKCFKKKLDKEIIKKRKETVYMDGKEVYIVNPIVRMQRVVNFCKTQYEIYEDLQGEHDEDTENAKAILNEANKVLEYLEKYGVDGEGNKLTDL